MLRTRFIIIGITLALAPAWNLVPAGGAPAQEPPPPPPISPAPNRGPDEGRGPFKTLAIRGAILIDGTGAPPQGPVDIVIENNRIKDRKSVV